jgi:prenyltransferase beta subunit
MKKKHTKKTMKMTMVATMLLHSKKDPYGICWSNNNLGIVRTNNFQKAQQEERQGGIMKCQTKSCIIACRHSLMHEQFGMFSLNFFVLCISIKDYQSYLIPLVETVPIK